MLFRSGIGGRRANGSPDQQEDENRKTECPSHSYSHPQDEKFLTGSDGIGQHRQPVDHDAWRLTFDSLALFFSYESRCDRMQFPDSACSIISMTRVIFNAGDCW